MRSSGFEGELMRDLPLVLLAVSPAALLILAFVLMSHAERKQERPVCVSEFVVYPERADITVQRRVVRTADVER